MTPEAKKRDAYYKRKYGITLADYQKMDGEQGGVCAICRRPPTKNRLAVDHSHKYKYMKIRTERVEGGWSAHVLSPTSQAYGATKSLAIQKVRQWLKFKSVRGLLCFSCNSGLRKYADDPVRFEAAAQYLRRHQNAN